MAYIKFDEDHDDAAPSTTPPHTIDCYYYTTATTTTTAISYTHIYIHSLFIINYICIIKRRFVMSPLNPNENHKKRLHDRILKKVFSQ